MWIVQLALRRPYTFVVLAMLIALFGVRAALRHSDRHLPEHQPAGDQRRLDLHRDAAGERHVGSHHLLLRAHADHQVNDIEHIESQSLNGYGIVKIFFQPSVKSPMRVAQVTAVSQTVLKYLPPASRRPMCSAYNASSVPILQLALSGKR